MCEDVKLCLRSDRNQGRRRFANGRSSTFSHFSLRQPRKYTRQKAGLFKVPPMFHPSAPFSTNRHVVYSHVCSSKKCNTSNARDGIRLRAPSVLRSRVLIGQLCGKVTMRGGGGDAYYYEHNDTHNLCRSGECACACACVSVSAGHCPAGDVFRLDHTTGH